MVTKAQKEKQEQENEQFSAWPVRVGLPGPANEDGTRPVAEYTVVAVCRTFNIARYLAYSIAMRGVPTSWPKEENKQNHPHGWWTSSVNKAQNMGRKLTHDVQSGAIQDRGILAAREMRGRGRLGPIIGELRQMAQESENPLFGQYVRAAGNALGIALSQSIMPQQESNYGVEWMRGHLDIIHAACDAWGVDHIDLNACANCGVDHNAQRDEIDVQELMEHLEQALGEVEEQQVPEVPTVA